MKKSTILLLLLILNFKVNAQSLQWAKTLNNIPSYGGFVQTEKVLLDASGNVYSCGNFMGIMDFDPGPATYTLPYNSFGSGVYILKLDPFGNFLWAKSLPILGSVGSMSLNSSGDVYLCGAFSLGLGAAPDFDPGPGTFTMSPSGGDGYILKLNSSGNFIWAKKLGSSGNDYCKSVAVDPSGNILITGSYQGNVDFDPNASTFFMNATNGIFVWKLTAAGTFVWAKSFQGTSSTGLGTSITTDGSGNIYSTGYFSGNMDFDPGPSTINLNALAQNVYLSKLDASGNYLWAKSVVSTSTAEPTSICLDQAGTNVYVTGEFIGTHDFDPSPATYSINTNFFSDGFVLKLDASGSFQTANSIGGNLGNDRCNSLVCDKYGSIYVTGLFSNGFNPVVDFDPSPATYTLPVNGYSDIFIAKYSSTGALEHALGLGGSLVNSSGRSIAVDTLCNVYTCGVFNNGTIDFDPSTALANYTNPLSGSDISFLLKLGECPFSGGNVAGTPTVCAGFSKTYSVSPVAWANGYSWSLPPGATITNGAGTNSIIVTFGANSGSIAVTPTNSCGGCNTSVYSVTVSPNPIISVSASNSVICQGNTITINATGANGYTVSPVAYVGQAITPNISTNYTVIGINYPSGCKSDPVIVPVLVNPTPNVSINASTLSICGGRPVTLQAVGADTYTWSGSVVNGQSFIPPSTSTYSVVGSFTQTGCTSLPAIVTVTVSPSAAFSYTTNGMQATFSVNGGCSNFLWDFGNGNTSSINPAPIVTYATNGVYSVCFKCNGTPIACLECISINVPSNVMGAVGIAESENFAGIQIFPNPSTGELFIETTQKINVSIYNSLGQVLLNQLLLEGKNQINISTLANGIYFLNQNESGLMKRIKLIKE